MLWAIDIGNTSISFGAFEVDNVTASGAKRTPHKSLLFSSKISSCVSRSSDELAAIFDRLFILHGCSVTNITRISVSSVVPHLTQTVCRAAETLCGIIPYVIGPGTHTGFRISIYDPATLGTDIVSNVSAALELSKPPIVVLDAGTANTLTFINSEGSLVGTIISPGLRISLESLTDSAEQLELISLNDTEIPWIGKNTAESISSGVVRGNALMADGFIRNIRENYISRDSDEKLSLIATGGYADIITSYTRNKFIIDKALTLNGIASLFLSNNKL